jgi:alkylation response protein AidB-like acyl-CoA dehydrogenase
VRPAADLESIEAFARRSATWMEAHLPGVDAPPADDAGLQRLLFDHGFAGIAFPREYGGAGLTLEHQKVFFDAAARLRRQVPRTYLVSIGMIGPTILDHGSHEAKLRFLPPLLRGDQVWIQLLSEPRGGSDMAGAVTRLTGDGHTYVLNGAKMWSTGAHEADFGLCLCRSDWDAPKHRGLSTIAVPLKGTPGLTVRRIRAANGLEGDFCEEFFDEVALPAANLIGGESEGWAVAQTLLLHERNAAGGIGYGYLGTAAQGESAGSVYEAASPAALAVIARGAPDDMSLAAMVADAFIDETVLSMVNARIMDGLAAGTHQGRWGSLSKLYGSVTKHSRLRAWLAVTGADGVIWEGDEVRHDNPGTHWLGSRGGTLAGGSNEMQRNIISERLLGLPREPSVERDRPYREVLGLWGRDVSRPPS